MTGGTHALAGGAAALLAAGPLPLTQSLGVCAAGAVGGLFCDVDSETSRISRYVKGAFFASGALLAALALAKRVTLTELPRTVLGVLLFLAAAVLSVRFSHRMVTHSLEYILLISLIAGMISPELAFPLTVGMLSHTALDLANRRSVRVSLLLNLKLSLGLCRSDGKADRLIRRLSTGILLALLACRCVQDWPEIRRAALRLFSWFTETMQNWL